jgi:acyl-CoA hydrolase/uncharacterized pyridoxamine 5'-phosphate oxidase family protein
MRGKKVSESETIMQHVPMPDENNVAGTLHGGYLLKHIDTVGGVAAARHCRRPVVTASLERMDFLTPIRSGELITLKASVNMAGRTSLEVGVRVEVEDLGTGVVRHAATCYLTYVALGPDERPHEVPPLIVETPDERRRYGEARRRREARKRAHEAQQCGFEGEPMKEVYEFLKKCGTYFIATVDGDRPKVRPFGTVNIFENKLYIQTGRSKAVARQMAVNNRIAISAADGDKWLRIEAEAVEDDRTEAKKRMLDAYPMLRSRYDENDGNTLVLYLQNATAVFESFTAEKKTVSF